MAMWSVIASDCQPGVCGEHQEYAAVLPVSVRIPIIPGRGSSMATIATLLPLLLSSWLPVVVSGKPGHTLAMVVGCATSTVTKKLQNTLLALKLLKSSQRNLLN